MTNWDAARLWLGIQPSKAYSGAFTVYTTNTNLFGTKPTSRRSRNGFYDI